MTQIEHLLRLKIGLEPASIGSAQIERCIQGRMKALGLRLISDYIRVLKASARECDHLIESVVVTETWFFRDREPFAAFVRMVRQDWMAANPGGVLRVLSLPCSSGEEPYSLAMALLDAGVPPKQFRIEGIDISTRALAHAQRAVYGRNSFRGNDLTFRTRYFQQTNAGYVLDPAVSNRVRLHQGNLLAGDFKTDAASYDFIFCRNLLIYFDSATRKRALARLNRMLSPTGVLFLGHAELSLALDEAFVSLNVPMAFACRKINGAPVSNPGVRSPARRFHELPPPPPALLPSDFAPAWKSSEPARSDQSDPPASRADLNLARRLADEGRLREAMEMCRLHLQQQGASAQAYYLLGLVHDASGHAQAAEYYRKALYLDPNHYETLLQLSLLARKNRDLDQARMFKQRAELAANESRSRR